MAKYKSLYQLSYHEGCPSWAGLEPASYRFTAEV